MSVHDPLHLGSTPAAQGMAESDWVLVRKRIWELLRVDLANYKSQQMVRRLNALLSRSGFPSWSQYFAHVERDAAAREELHDYLTINVTKFFRDAAKWQQLAETILPLLLAERRRLRIWSAGCADGAESYTLAIVLRELGAGRNQHYLVATDIDDRELAKARAGGPYSTDEMEYVDQAIASRYFEVREGSWWARREVLPSISFRHHDLLQDEFENNLDLIVCRNVIIYFADGAKRILYRRFADALRPGGFLFLGGTETIPPMPGLPLKPYLISFYRKEPKP